jgi:hypothetical protein
MAINDSMVTRYVNETTRPLAEAFRDLYFKCKDAKLAWDGSISALCPVDGGDVEDGRDSEGVSRLTGNDVVGMQVRIADFITAMEQVGVLDVVRKPCVRNL